MAGLKKFYDQVWMAAGGGARVATISANDSLNDESAHIQILTASGAHRDLSLQALPGVRSYGRWFAVRNAGATYNVVVKNAAGSTLATLVPGAWGVFIAANVSGTPAWHVALSSVGLASLALTGALTAVGIVSTGAITTTDGVASGTARKVGGTASVAVAGVSVTNTTSETDLGSYAVPASTIKAGTSVRVRGSFRVTGHNGTPTVTFKLKLGSTDILAPTALSMVTNDRMVFDAILTGRAAAAASAAVASSGFVSATQSGTAISVPVAAAPSNFATDGALTLKATATWSAAHASNSLTCEQFEVEVVG